MDRHGSYLPTLLMLQAIQLLLINILVILAKADITKLRKELNEHNQRVVIDCQR